MLDASWSHTDGRVAAADVARTSHAEMVGLQCSVPAAVAAERADRRHRRGDDASDADARTAGILHAEFALWPEAEVVSTAAAPETVVDDVIARLTEGDAVGA